MMAYVFWVSPQPPPPLPRLSLLCPFLAGCIKTVFASHNILEKAYFILEKCTVLHFLGR